MKKIVSLSLLITLITHISFSQKEDKVWVLGYRYSDQSISNGIYFHFDDSLTIEYKTKPVSLKESNISICDSTGGLLLVSNSCYIETGDGFMVENSDGLNPGWVYDNFCKGPYDFNYNASNNMVLLPSPDSPSVYYLFHTRTFVIPQPFDAFRDVLFHTKVDMSLNNGNGKVLFKNNSLVQDTLHPDGLHAVRHANGRDWWVVTAKSYSNKYYLLFLTSNGITVKEQNIGEPTLLNHGGGQIVFSPNGTKMARFNTRDGLRIFDFDRCTGELSNPLYISLPGNEDEVSAGLAFSADGHYLYASEVKQVSQFDMWASDIASSRLIIAEWQTNPDCNLGRSIGYLELAPDGRIYSRPLSGQRCMHRLSLPERPGTDSKFEHQYYQFDFAYKGLPHFPNFRLGPIDGSPCDTLGIDNHPLAGWRYDKTGGLGVDFTSVSWYEPTLWQWDFGDPASGTNNNSAEKHPTHTFSAPGGYEVCLTVSNQYGSDMKCKMVWVGVSSLQPDPSKAGEVTFWPNPTTGEVRWAGTENEEVGLRLYDALGRMVLEQTTSESRADLGGLPEGLYWLQFLSERGPRFDFKPVILRKI